MSGANNGATLCFVEYRGELYFGADDGTGTEPWKTDGTETGTVKVLNLVLGLFPRVSNGTSGHQKGGLANGSAANPVAVVNDRLLFTANTAATGIELWTFIEADNAVAGWTGC
jgi:ELWxxDGT repeat protein